MRFKQFSFISLLIVLLFMSTVSILAVTQNTNVTCREIVGEALPGITDCTPTGG